MAYLAGAGRTISSLESELGLTYNQIWTTLVKLQRLDPQRTRGSAVLLSEDDVVALRGEVDRRVGAAADVMLLSEAATTLDLPVLTVETLIRRGELGAVPAPDATRHRYLTRTSVDAYLTAHPVAATSDPSALAVPVADARAALGLTRPEVAQLVRSRQLVAVTRHRRQCISLLSLQHYLGKHPRSGAAELLAASILSP